MEQRIKIFRYIFLTQHGYVCINISSSSQIGMTKPLGHILQRPTLIVENTGCAVPNIVETQTRQTMLFQYLLKITGYVIRTVGLAVAPDKDIS